MIGQLRTAVPVAGYGDLGAWGLTADQLTDYANQAILNARKGLPLASLRAELAPTQMLVAPTNAVGAYLRVAYWLAQGARPTPPGGAPDGRLLLAAETAQRNAQAASGFTLFSAQSEVGKITEILADGVKVAESAGRNDVAAVLWSMRADAKDAPAGSWLSDPAGRLKLAGIGGVVLAVALGGALLWSLKPYADIAAAALPKRK